MMDDLEEGSLPVHRGTQMEEKAQPRDAVSPSPPHTTTTHQPTHRARSQGKDDDDDGNHDVGNHDDNDFLGLTNVPRSQLVLERAVAPCIPGHEIRRSRARNASPHIDVRASGMQSMLRDSTI